MENFSLIKYKWEYGIYSLDKMISLVQQNQINKKDFFTITGYNFDGLNKVFERQAVEKRKKLDYNLMKRELKGG